MTPDQAATIIRMVGKVEKDLGSVSSKVDVIEERVKSKPCERHEDELKAMRSGLIDVEKKQIADWKRFVTMLLATSIPMIPIAIVLFKLSTKLE